MVLHTWGQTLTEHYHVHGVVSGGGLSVDRRSWVALPKGKKKRRRAFLFHVAALSAVFRGKFIAALTRARQRGTLCYVGQSAALATAAPWEQLLRTLWSTDWVVYSKRPFGGPAQVLKYLSRYTHRVAISNQRLLAVGDGTVRFAYHDYADHHQRKELSLPAVEFLRRFLQHVVPTGFMRIRHYGLTANCQCAAKLARCRELLGHSPAPPAPDPVDCAPRPGDADGSDSESARCPACGGVLRVIDILVPTPLRWDTS
jgi:putative transposase